MVINYGKVVSNGTILGVISDKQFYKVELKQLASQVIDEDIVEFKIVSNKAQIERIISRTPQSFIGIISKITPKSIYLNLPLLNPYSSIAHPILYSKSLSVGTKILGEITLDKINITGFYENDKQLIRDYYIHFMKQNKIPLDISLNSIPKLNNPYKDLTHLKTFHIDPSGCIDIDDFMSIDKESNTIYIHIIDITKYIPLNSKEDLEERKIGYTWYFPDLTIHLHPTEKIFVSNEFYCLTLEIKIDEKDNIQKVEFYSSKIQCQYDFIYQDVQDIFDGKKVHPLKDDLLWSLDVIQSIYFPNPSHYRKKVWKKNKEDNWNLELEDELLAHRFVSSWMIYYNSWIAEHFQVPQRFHPETKIFQPTLSQDLPLEVQHILNVKQMRQAEYREEGGHFGLNKKWYTHSTSPLRRYFDRLIQNICLGIVKDISQELLEHLNRLERLSERVSEWYERQLLLAYVKNNKNRLWDGYVIKKHLNGLEIYIYDLQEFLFLSNSQNLFDNNSIDIGNKIKISLLVDETALPRLILNKVQLKNFIESNV